MSDHKKTKKQPRPTLTQRRHQVSEQEHSDSVSELHDFKFCGGGQNEAAEILRSRWEQALDAPRTLREIRAVGWWYLDVESGEFFASSSAVGSTHCKPQDKLDYTAGLGSIHFADRSYVEAQIEQTINTGRPGLIVFRASPFDGQEGEHRLALQVKVISGPNGPRLLATVQEITEQSKLQAYIEVLDYLDGLAQHTENPDALLWATAETIGNNLRVSRCFFAEIDRMRSKVLIHPDFHHGLPSLAGTQALSGLGALLEAELKNNHTIIVNDVLSASSAASDALSRSVDLLGATHAYIVVCIKRDARRTVVFWIGSAIKRAWSVDEVDLVSRVAERIWHVIERQRLQSRLSERERQLRQLSSQLLQAQENERKRIANEIHDNAGQVLAAIKYRVESAYQKLEKSGSSEALQPVKDLIPTVQACIDDLRRLQMELRPTILDDMGVKKAVEWFCREFQKTYPSITVERTLTVNEAELPEPLKLVIFRIVQEALNNAGKHSSAEQVSISLQKKGGALVLHIEDNGDGFDLDKAPRVEAFNKGLGLSSMRERVQYSGGRLFIKSAPGQGTRIEARWPKRVLT